MQLLNYEEAVDYIFNIPRFKGKNEFEVTKQFLEHIGDISTLIPTIHVAGTNGKGSVCALLRSALEENGYSVGMFTSPHLVTVRERFLVNETLITKEDFTDSFNAVMKELEAFKASSGETDYHPSFFEMLFFMACIYYRKMRPDFLILETGLGGRLDATNTISSPVATVITEIGLDHMEYLGDTKEKIAGEKAGIIKPHVPVIFASRHGSWDHVIEERAMSLKSPVFKTIPENIKNLETTAFGIDFSFQSLYDDSEFLCLPIKAPYQAENAGLAFLTIKALKGVKSDLNLKKAAEGMKNVKWPGRMEEVRENLILDGGHNEDGIEAFLNAVKVDGRKRRSLLFSGVLEKNIEANARKISDSNLFEKVYVCTLSDKRKAPLERLEAAFDSASMQVSFYDSVDEGLKKMMSENSEGCVMYVAGSLYLVGEVKKLLGGCEDD
jgi:dihydrofolate synthase/folylpolyglutamate synthase